MFIWSQGLRTSMILHVVYIQFKLGFFNLMKLTPTSHISPNDVFDTYWNPN